MVTSISIAPFRLSVISSVIKTRSRGTCVLSSLGTAEASFHLFFYFSSIHILGSFQNIKVARTALCSLILGEDFQEYR